MSRMEIENNGWTAVPLDPSLLFDGRPFRNQPQPLLVSQMKFPSEDPIVAQVQAHAKQALPSQTFNHSMRVFYFASAIMKQQFPEENKTLSPSTLAVTALLHDIGTAEENLTATNMSFEFYGGFKAMNLLLELGAAKNQAEAVAETIIRHQDLGTAGKITLLGQVIHLATIYDNVSNHPYLDNSTDIIHDATLRDVVEAFPRDKWLGCFARTIEQEEDLKPWCHSTHIPDFAQAIRSNKFMQRFE